MAITSIKIRFSILKVKHLLLGFILSQPMLVAAQWKTDTLSQARSTLISASVGTKVFFAGGGNLDGYSHVIDVYDTSSHQWSTDSLSIARQSLCATSVGTKVFFAGGDAGGNYSDVVDIFDTSTNTWSTAALSQPRQDLVATAVGNKVFFAGGSGDLGISDVVDIYDLLTNTWSTYTLSIPRVYLMATSLGTKAYFAGGFDGTDAIDTIDIYDASTDSWSTSNLPRARLNGASSACGTKLFFGGGYIDTSGGLTNLVDIYDSEKNTWQTDNLSEARTYLTATSFGTKIFFAGGYNGTTDLDRVDIYDTGLSSWSSSKLSIGRSLLTAVSNNNSVYFAGGLVYSIGAYSNVVDIFDLNASSTLPFITSFSPLSAKQGSTVTISGANFSNVTSVSFGGTPASTFSITSSSTITAAVGNGASGSIEVKSLVGAATKPGFNFISNQPPTLSSFTPLSGGTGTTITINGSNFIGATSVSFGGIPASSFNVVSSTSINAVVGSGASGSISVSTPLGTSTISGFTFLQAPTISSFTPTTAYSGTTVTIYGTNFSTVTGVSFGGTQAASFKLLSPTSISAIVGNGATGNVSVTTVGGSAIKAGFIFKLSSPVISYFMPILGGTGTSVMITGTDFTGATAVSFGGVSASSFIVLTNTTISAVVGSGATGSVSVTTPNGTTTLNGFSYIPPPTITSFTPITGTNGTKITILGTNFFSGINTVTFGGILASSFTINSATSITATVGAGSSGNISLTSLGGNISKSGFVYVTPPTISSFSPTKGQSGTVVTISGSNFSNTITENVVKFNGISASISSASSTSIIATVPTGATTGKISVEVGSVASTSSNTNFCINPPLKLVTSSNSICLGNFAVLTASGAYSYSWYPDTGLSSTYGSVVTASPTVSTTFTLNGYDVYGCSSSVSVPITVNNSCTVPGLASGGSVDAYRMVSIPMKLSDPRVETVLSALLQKYGGYNQEKMRLVRYTNGINQEYQEGFSTFDQGKSYWLLSVDPIDISISGNKLTSTPSNFTMNLTMGWNQIGNPFGFDISWSDVLAKNSSNANVGNLYVYDPTTVSFKLSDNLKSWGGGFVNATTNTNLQIPITVKQATGGRIMNDNNFANETNSWFVPFQLKHGESLNDLGGIGMHPKSELGKDGLDENSLPRFIKYLELNSYHNDYFQPRFMKDIVPVKDSFNWEMVAESNLNAGEATLIWDCNSIIGNGARLVLLDKENGALIDMTKQSEYIFDLKNQHKLTVMYATSEAALSAPYTIIGSPYPNPSAAKLIIPVVVGDNQGSTIISVYDISGKKVEELTNDKLEVGYHEFVWDGNNSRGERVSPGIYLIRLGQSNTENNSFRVILK